MVEPISIGTIAGLVEKCLSLFHTLHKSHKAYASIDDKIDCTKSLLRDTNTSIKGSCVNTNYDDEVNNNWMLDLEKIKRKIEGCIDNFNYYTIFPGNKESDDQLKGFAAPTIVGVEAVLKKPETKALFEDLNKIDDLVRNVLRNKELIDSVLTNKDRESSHGYGYDKVDKRVGIETPRVGLVQLLMNKDTEEIVVIPIYGPSGSGKSVLANAVYEHVEEEFDFRAQVTASCCKLPSKLLECIIKDFELCSQKKEKERCEFNLAQAGHNPQSYLKKQLRVSKDKRFAPLLI